MYCCTRCGHPYNLHLLGQSKRCRMRIATGWDERKKTYTDTCRCLCPGYRGLMPDLEHCPHEYLPGGDRCMACGHVKTAWESRWQR